MGILKCSSDTLDMVWSALSGVQLVNKVPVTIRVLAVCSTVRTLRPTVTKLFEAATLHLNAESTTAQSGAAAQEADTSQQTAEQKFLQIAKAELQECVTTS